MTKSKWIDVPSWPANSMGGFGVVRFDRERLMRSAPQLAVTLRAFVQFHSGHVLPPELQHVMVGARAVLKNVEGEP